MVTAGEQIKQLKPRCLWITLDGKEDVWPGWPALVAFAKSMAKVQIRGGSNFVLALSWKSPLWTCRHMQELLAYPQVNVTRVDLSSHDGPDIKWDGTIGLMANVSQRSMAPLGKGPYNGSKIANATIKSADSDDYPKTLL